MSKLDDILISDKVGNPLYDQPFESEEPEYLELKQQIKDLMLDTDFSLTFEEQRLIERLAMNATTASSNQNKYRFDLFAEIAHIAEGKLRSKVELL